MKKLLLLSTLTLSSLSFGNCQLILLAKKPTSKTYYLSNGEKLNKSVLNKLKGICDIKIKLMSKKEVAVLKVKELEAKLIKARKEVK